MSLSFSILMTKNIHNFDRELDELRHKEVHDPTDLNAYDKAIDGGMEQQQSWEQDQADREAVKDGNRKVSRRIPELISIDDLR
ncbi:hypothetical protein LINGRAHAP2_LOCUS11478 [Linum grandiflorum]